MSDCISRKALLDRYDAEHVGPPGRARELIITAPAARKITRAGIMINNGLNALLRDTPTIAYKLK